jgi:hypothetical protein
LTGPNYVTETNKPAKAKPEKVKTAKAKPAKVKGVTAKLVVTTVGNTKVGSIVKGAKTVHPDGTVFFREDRQKWVAMWNGKQEAARPTAEACLAFLKKKYNVEGVVLK